MELVIAGIGIAAVAFGIAAAALPALERAAHAIDLVDRPGGRKQHTGALPLTGGIAVLLAVAIPAVGGLLVALSADVTLGVLPEALSRHLPGVRTKALELLAILAGAGVHLLLGHLDDRRGLSPWTRLGIEAAVAAGLCALGVRLSAHLPWPAAHWALTIVFVVFVTNAVNFIDNMNGLMPGTVLIAAVNLLVLSVGSGQLFMAAILSALAGGLLAFLPRNFPRARVIMGDAGSLPLGFLLAAFVVELTFGGPRPEGPSAWLPILSPLLVLAVPLYDGVTVSLRRLARGVHPFTAGRDHVSHRLVDRGLSPRAAVLRLWGLGLGFGLVPALLTTSPLVIVSIWAPILLVAALLLRPWSPVP